MRCYAVDERFTVTLVYGLGRANSPFGRRRGSAARARRRSDTIEFMLSTLGYGLESVFVGFWIRIK